MADVIVEARGRKFRTRGFKAGLVAVDGRQKPNDLVEERVPPRSVMAVPPTTTECSRIRVCRSEKTASAPPVVKARAAEDDRRQRIKSISAA